MTASCRRGFTLVELLVVTGLMAGFLGLLAIGLRPSEQSQVRAAAQSFASLLIQTQSRAIGNPSGACVLVQPSQPAASSTSASTVLEADSLPLIMGTASMPLSTGTTVQTKVNPSNADDADLLNGYRICFLIRRATMLVGETSSLAPTPWFNYSCTNPSANQLVSFRQQSITVNGQNASYGQTLTNTIWPAASANGLDVLISRYPTAGPPALTFPSFVAIDLQFSGIGNDPYTDFGSLRNSGAIAITFNSVGRRDWMLRSVLSTPSQRKAPISAQGDLYLLVASQSAVASGSALASDQAQWVTIAASTGRVSVSRNIPQNVSASLLDSVDEPSRTALRNAVFAARANARVGLNRR